MESSCRGFPSVGNCSVGSMSRFSKGTYIEWDAVINCRAETAEERCLSAVRRDGFFRQPFPPYKKAGVSFVKCSGNLVGHEKDRRGVDAIKM